MDKRKIIAFGKNSYVVSLPKAWVEENKIKKGDDVIVIVSDSDIMISPSSKIEKLKREIQINCEGREFSAIKREIYSSYINSASVLTIKNFKESERDDLKEVIDNLFAFEIIDQSQTKFVLKDYLDLQDIELKEVIRRIDNITRSMFTESINAVKTKKPSYLGDIDKDVNKLSYLALKLVKMCIEKPSASKILKINKTETVLIWELIARIENIADSTKRISRISLDLGKKDLDKLTSLYNELKEDFNKIMTGYYTKNKHYLDEVLQKNDKQRSQIFKLNNIKKDENFTITIECLHKIHESNKNIARSILNTII